MRRKHVIRVWRSSAVVLLADQMKGIDKPVQDVSFFERSGRLEAELTTMIHYQCLS
jgi:hypothetical protein